MLDVIELGRISYEDAYERQLAEHARLLAGRDDPKNVAPGVVLLLEHDPPVITLPRRPGAGDHILASESQLQGAGVRISRTDRGGDVTYHGPGQLVAYVLLDLQRIGLRLDGYLRMLEQGVIDVLGAYGLRGLRDCGATGVWLPDASKPESDTPHAKVCAIGVRVRRWITMHGLALNVRTNLDHFRLIVPCGLERPVTSLDRELGERAPGVGQAGVALAGRLDTLVRAHASGQPASSCDAGQTP